MNIITHLEITHSIHIWCVCWIKVGQVSKMDVIMKENCLQTYFLYQYLHGIEWCFVLYVLISPMWFVILWKKNYFMDEIVSFRLLFLFLFDFFWQLCWKFLLAGIRHLNHYVNSRMFNMFLISLLCCKFFFLLDIYVIVFLFI